MDLEDSEGTKEIEATMDENVLVNNRIGFIEAVEISTIHREIEEEMNFMMIGGQTMLRIQIAVGQITPEIVVDITMKGNPARASFFYFIIFQKERVIASLNMYVSKAKI
jgi:hypothetical protein